MRGLFEDEFEQLCRRFRRSIHGFFIQRGFSPEESQELTQETFLRVYKGWTGFRRTASVKTWLFSIARNVYRNAVRDQTADKRDGQEVPIDRLAAEDLPRQAAADGPLDRLLNAERMAVLNQAIEELPVRMRCCVVLRLDQALSYPQIATVMRISVQTVKSQLSQARSRLRKRLADHFEGIDEL